MAFVADVTSFAEEYGFKDGMVENMLDVATMDGKIYGIPRDGYALSLMMNVEMFRQADWVMEAGVPIYPKTYEELAQTAKKIKDATGKAGIVLPTRDRQGGCSSRMSPGRSVRRSSIRTIPANG